jgi:hypothetical protein
MSDAANDRDFPYLAEGNEEERQGVSGAPLREDYEISALRDEVARLFEDLIGAVQAWREDDDTGEADEIYQELSELYDRVGGPLENTDSEEV